MSFSCSGFVAQVFDFVRTSRWYSREPFISTAKNERRQGKMGGTQVFFPIPPGTESCICEKSPPKCSLAFWKRSAISQFQEDPRPHSNRCKGQKSIWFIGRDSQTSAELIHFEKDSPTANWRKNTYTPKYLVLSRIYVYFLFTCTKTTSYSSFLRVQQARHL